MHNKDKLNSLRMNMCHKITVKNDHQGLFLQTSCVSSTIKMTAGITLSACPSVIRIFHENDNTY